MSLFTFLASLSNHNHLQMTAPKNTKQLSGQSTLSEDENGLKSEDSTLTLNEGNISRQSSSKRKDSKYSKSRSPIMQSLNPTQLQPPILKEQPQNLTETKRSLQRTFRVDMNNEETTSQPLLTQSSPIPSGVIPSRSKSPAQVNSGWL